MDLVYRFASSIARLPVNVNTAGRPLTDPSAGPTLRVGPGTPAPHVGIPPFTPPVRQAARLDGIATVRHDPPPHFASVPRSPSPAPAPYQLPPPHATTFSSAVGQAFVTPPTLGPPRRAKRALVIAGAGAVALGALVVVGLVVSGGSDERAAATTVPASPPSPAARATSDVAIVTEPSGATVYVGGAARGTAPMNIAAPVGAELEIRAELAGHVASVERVRVGAEPAAVRLTLAPEAPKVDASVLPPIDAGAATERQVDAGTPRRNRPRPPPRETWEFDPDGVVRPNR